jgi:hypothetical protein
MGAITINDLPKNLALDRQAMSSIRGAVGVGVGQWVFFCSPPTPSLVPAVNFYQVNNSFYANQMINQSQIVNINNSGANSNINAVLISSNA